MARELTPMMRQYLDIKEEHKDSILFFRLGDFYEMFFDDAIEASRILHITLTSRGASKGKKVPMCGIPYHAASNYIARLIKQGRKVAICEQTEEPTPGKKIVNRDVIRIITPGTFLAEELLDASINNYILSINSADGHYGIAYADISTGEFRLTEIDNTEQLFSEMYKLSPSECLIPGKLKDQGLYKELSDINMGLLTVNEDWHFDPDLSRKEILRHFSVSTLEGFGCEAMPAAIGSAGALLRYLKHTQKNTMRNLDVISTYRSDQFMTLDRNTQRHLELVRNREDLTPGGTLMSVLDRTRTAMGRRKLKKWILNPLLDKYHIDRRLDAVNYFHQEKKALQKVRDALDGVYDIERLSNKASMGSAGPRDLKALSASLKRIKEIRSAIKGILPEYLEAILSDLKEHNNIIQSIDRCIVDNPPTSVKEGGLIREGFDQKVDELNKLVSRGKDWVADLQRKEIRRTGISSLKVSYNKVFGYYIEVTKANLDSVPDDYIRKQTLVNSERFITHELKEEEARIIGAEERIKELEYRLFCELRQKVGEHIEELKKTADMIAKIDVISDLASVALTNKYIRPEINTENRFQVEEARHPVLESMLKDKEFVPNDIEMDDKDNRIHIITGSNMAGKSTFIRQTALLSVMAQAGSFVPAASASIGIVDKIFTRVGASDRIYQGMSTFMVEMLETANILNNATAESLIILDEVGRGTSTYDGVSIAWAVVEHIHERIKGAKALFATHYHELTELASLSRGIRNCHLAVQEYNEDIIFLYKVKPGSCDESFGIHVAKLAGMPSQVVSRAREILANLHEDSFSGGMQHRFGAESAAADKQPDLFDTQRKEDDLRAKLESADVNGMTPLEALQFLADLKKGAL